MSKKDDSPECEWRYDFESAQHGEIVYHVMEAEERDCLQAKHSVHERSERT